MDLHEYFNLCADHDWFFDFNKKASQYEIGLNEMNILLKYYRQEEKYKHIYNSWADYKKYDEKIKPDFKDFK